MHYGIPEIDDLIVSSDDEYVLPKLERCELNLNVIGGDLTWQESLALAAKKAKCIKCSIPVNKLGSMCVGCRTIETKKINYTKKMNSLLRDYTTDNWGYIYIIKLREFIKSGESIFKIGRTDNLLRRLGQYPKGSIPIFTTWVRNCVAMESLVKLECCTNFIQRKDIGIEYFEAKEVKLKKLVQRVINKYDDAERDADTHIDINADKVVEGNK